MHKSIAFDGLDADQVNYNDNENISIHIGVRTISSIKQVCAILIFM